MGGVEEKGEQKSFVSHQINGLTCKAINSNSFVVDIERFSSLTNTDKPSNSRITLQGNFPRKGFQSGKDKKITSNSGNNRGTNLIPTSPRAALKDPNKILNPQPHHQIAIMTTTAAREGKSGGRKSILRRSSWWTIQPMKVFFFCSAISFVGCLLVIFLTIRFNQQTWNGPKYENNK